MQFMPLARRWLERPGECLVTGLLRWVLILMFGMAVVSACRSAERIGPTVQDLVEFTRIEQPRNSDADALQTQVSPDGRRAFIVTRTAEMATDRNLFRILLLDLDPQRLQAQRPAEPRTVLTIAARRDSSYLDPAIRDVRWVGPETLVFRGRVDDGLDQVYRVDVGTGRLAALTSETLPIVSFAVSDDLRQVVYVAQIPKPPLPTGARSVVVGNQSFWSIKFGQGDMRAQDRQYRYFVASRDGGRQARPLGPVFPESSSQPPGVSISPDGRWALLPRYEPERQLAWADEYPLVGELARLAGPSLGMDPIGYFSRPRSYVARRLVAYRLADGHEQAVVDAPDDAYPGVGQTRSDRLWQRGGKSVVIAGTHLPLSAGRGSGSHLVEYWPDTGRLEVIASLQGRLDAAYPVPGSHDAFVAIDGTQRRWFERTPDGRWKELDRAPAAAGGLQGVSLRLDQALNQPPDVWATTAAGQSVRLTHLNPGYSAETWGVAKPYTWRDAKGRQWDGGLLLPAGFVAGKRYPLVIQTYGFATDRFYLDGANIADGVSSGFAGRAFLREGLLVLALPLGPSTGRPTNERGGVDAFADGVRGAIDALVGEGLVDAERIGLMGWSATGERALNLLTFTDTRIRAATLLDGDANTLFSVAVTYGAGDNMLTRKEAINGGSAFGNTLRDWVRNDPALHTDCVRAALRIETYGPWVLNNWDIYALLRRQYKPAEMVVIPDGTHSLSRPSERMISLQGNVDWYRFWLLGEERHDPVLKGETAQTLEQQYTRWRQMAELRGADERRPRCERVQAGP
ncbi:S9 family peptidase [Rubrivivax benzoatilyticus]|nr:hypothetical protein [Rubrivivax benzoatilyticus]EGJ12171.1 hypothetical protein RBXJA2T_17656 [Rubrivivax benzoatilyticus JA2 = ATCC BAA-35]